jgi:hypothetical protein
MRRFHVRRAEPADRSFILALVPRLAEFGPPWWRDPEQMTRRVREVLGAVLNDTPASSAVLVAHSLESAE